jgi:hypothetical protein
MLHDRAKGSAMSEWNRERIAERQRQGLREARLQAHYAVQWLGRLGGAFIPPQPDYGHTGMSWNDALAGFTTQALPDGSRFGLRIGDLLFVFLNKAGERTESYPMHGRTDREVRQMLGVELGARGLNAAAVDKVAPYEIPAHAIAAGAAYDVGGVSGFLNDLAYWFAEADSALGKIREQALARSLAASPVRGWPHHFDVATLISLDAGGGEHGRSVNAGLSPGDGYYEEPYYYVSPYPYPEPAALPALRSPLGHWHTRDFTAAIAPASKIVMSKNRAAETEAFLNEAVAAATQALGSK